MMSFPSYAVLLGITIMDKKHDTEYSASSWSLPRQLIPSEISLCDITQSQKIIFDLKQIWNCSPTMYPERGESEIIKKKKKDKKDTLTTTTAMQEIDTTSLSLRQASWYIYGHNTPKSGCRFLYLQLYI